MATKTLTQSGTGNANMQVQLTYTAGGGKINITEVRGRRTDGYDTLGSQSSNRVHIAIGDKTFTLTPSASDSYYIRFTKNSVWSAPWAGISASRDDLAGNTKIKITFTCKPTANIANSIFEGTIDAGYKTPSMTLLVGSRGLTSINFNYNFTNTMPEKVQLYNETTGSIAYEGSSLSPNATGLARNTTYKFKIRGYANGEWGAYSSTISATTLTGATVTAITQNITNSSPSIAVTFTNDLTGVTPTYTLKDAGGKLNKSGNLSNTITLTPAEITALLNGYPNLKSSESVALTLTTSTAGIVTSTNTTYFKIVDSNPTLGTVTYVDTNDTIKAITKQDTQILVGKSTVKLTIPKMTLKNGAQEGSYTVKVDNTVVKTITGNGSSSYTADIGVISKTNSVVQVSGLDSRQNPTNTYTVSLDTYVYGKPIKTTAEVKRKNLIEEESRLSAAGTYTYFSNFDDTNRIKSMSYRYRNSKSSTGWSTSTPITSYTYSNGNWSITDLLLVGDTSVGFNISNSYVLEVTIEDILGTNTFEVPIKGASPTMWVDKKNRRVGVRKKPTTYAFEVDGDIDVTGNVYANGKPISGGSSLESVYPVNSIYLSLSATNPKDIFGFGEWDLIKDKFLIGAGNTYSVKASGGAMSHSVSIAHTHTLNGHTHSYSHTHGVPGVSHSHSVPSHTHTLDSNGWAKIYFGGSSFMAKDKSTGNWTGNAKKTVSGTTSSSTITGTYGVELGGVTGGVTAFNTGNTTPGAATTNSQSTSTTGGSSANTSAASVTSVTVDNTPPYYAVYMWVRIG